MTQPPPGTLTTATVLFTDIVNSTATRSRLGEELADRHFERAYKLLRGVVEAGGAIFTKSLGDGLMAVFESASAGLDAVTAVERALIADNSWAKEPTSIHAALSAGDISWQEDDISGRPVVQAAQLVELAAGGQVLCTDVVRRLARDRGRHEFRDLSGPDAEGLPATPRTCELLWQHADDRSEWLAPWLAGSHILPFVGREAELAILDGALEATQSGTSLVILQGDPGVGKTRLVSVVAQRASNKGFTVLAGRCTDPARLPYEPMAAAIERLAHTSPDLLLRAEVGQECGQLVRLAPSLSAPPLSLSVPTVPEPVSNHRLTAVSERQQLVAATRTFFERLTNVRPVLLIIDDLHAATTESLQLLRALLWDTEKLPLLIVATSRPIPDLPDSAEADPGVLELHELQAESRVVSVPPFGLDDVAAALASVTGAAVRVAMEEAARLHQKTGGNAYLVAEVIRDLAGGGTLGEVTVPDSVTRMVRERLSRLSRDARHLLHVLAVGEQLTSAALRTAMDVDHLRFLTAAEEVLATGLVSMPPTGWCQFSHELTRTAIYDGLSSPRASLLHGRVADAFRTSEPQIMETRPYVVATHLLAAAERDHDPDRTAEAVVAVERAAEDAIDRLAHGEAVVWYRHLVRLLEDGPAASPERLAEALVRCGRAMWLAGDPQARATLVRAAELAEGSDRQDLIVEAALAGDRGFYSMTARADPRRIDLLTRARQLVDPADVRTRALLTAQLAAELTWAPDDSHRRFELSDEAVGLARRSADPRTIVSVLGLRSFTVIPAEPLERRIQYGKELLEAAQRTGDDLALFHATFQLIPVALDTGDFERVAQSLEQADELAQRLARPHFVWLVKMCRTGLMIMRGDIAVAERTSGEMLEMGKAIGRGLEALAFYAEQIGEIRRLQGRLGELRGRLRQSAPGPRLDPVHAVLRYLCELDDEAAGPLLDRILDERGLMPPENMAQRSALDNLAVAACRLGRRELMEPLYEALVPQAETFGISAVAHHCGHHYLALLSAASGAAARAIDHFAAAARVHERCGAPLLMAESLLDWALLMDRTRADGPDPAALRRRCADVLNGYGALLLERRLARESG
ncbi:MAG TPA: AAA family ATPase [Streptosporangiaceae bacterium]|nr:AAA family ATPase [Streptosporangiaceae bacterium]